MKLWVCRDVRLCYYAGGEPSRRDAEVGIASVYLREGVGQRERVRGGASFAPRGRYSRENSGRR